MTSAIARTNGLPKFWGAPDRGQTPAEIDDPADTRQKMPGLACSSCFCLHEEECIAASTLDPHTCQRCKKESFNQMRSMLQFKWTAVFRRICPSSWLRYNDLDGTVACLLKHGALCISFGVSKLTTLCPFTWAMRGLAVQGFLQQTVPFSFDRGVSGSL